jgi:hypothetical protein
MPTQCLPAPCAPRRGRSASRDTRPRALPTLLSLSLAAGLAGVQPALAATRGAAGTRDTKSGQARRQPVPLLLLPLATVVGASTEAATRFGSRLELQLRGLEAVRLVQSAAPAAARRPAPESLESATAEKMRTREQLETTALLAEAGRHEEAAKLLTAQRERLLQAPLALDAEGGLLYAELLEQLALARTASGDGEGAGQALEERAGLTLEAAPSGRRPPALQQALAAARQRVLARARGSLRVLVRTGQPARILLDGQLFGTAPLLLTDVPAGLHILRVERGGAAFAERVRIAPASERLLEPRLDDGDAGPLGDLLATLSLGRLDRPAAAIAARLAKAAGARAAFIGAVAAEGEGQTVHSFLVDAGGAQVTALPRTTFEPGAPGTSLALALAIENRLRAARGAVGAAVRLPATFAAPSPEASALAVVSVAPSGPQEVAPAAVASAAPAAVAPPPPLPPPTLPQPAATDPLEEAPSAPRAVAIPGAAQARQPTPRIRSAIGPAEALDEPGAPATGPPPVPSTTPTAAQEPAERIGAPVVPLRAPSPSAEPRRAAMRPPATRSGPAPAAALRPEGKEVAVVREDAAGRGSRALWIVAGALLAGGLGAGGYLLYQGSRSPTTATISVHVGGGP